MRAGLKPMPVRTDRQTGRCELNSPIAMPRASAFLWNPNLLLQVNCRGYVTAQHLQPEPARYAYAPNLEARTFMQPEQPYYTHHPGRFFYLKDEQTGQCVSFPHEPMRARSDSFKFSVGQSNICWEICTLGLTAEMRLSIPADDAVELWTFNLANSGGSKRQLSIYPYFTVGYMSWMNQSAAYRPDLGGVVARCVTPYQKVEDADRIMSMKDQTFLLHDQTPDAWETSLDTFEGEGGLPNPDGLQQLYLSGGDAHYETPAAILQYRRELEPGKQARFQFLFGPARNTAEISALRDRYLGAESFATTHRAYETYLKPARGCLQVKTPDAEMDDFINLWLGRQVYYHGATNRMCTDPQTRNYLQDALGLAYTSPADSRRAFLIALSQQHADGRMPDGVLLHEQAELKYINQVPHSDHCVWLPVCLQAYLDETGDYGLLEEKVTRQSDGSKAMVADCIGNAMNWLLRDRDGRGLNYIAQGDWCDPMNMVGHKGRGVSGWLSIATIYAVRSWARICSQAGHPEWSDGLLAGAEEVSEAVQKHLWDGNWFARGITDDDTVFGVSSDPEGRIFLNPQAWAMLAEVASEEQINRMIQAVEEQLEGPYGVEMLAPAYTCFRDDVGRVTQKFPGTAENGSVYNHASAFYIFALFGAGKIERGYRLLRQMIPGPAADDYLRRGQLPVFIPNYYRGAARQFPRTAGRSSQLFNTGTASWVYRIVIEQLFGLKGCVDGLMVNPMLPVAWKEARAERTFRGALFDCRFVRRPDQQDLVVEVDGERIQGQVIRTFKSGGQYRVDITLPAGNS